ncbi:MAG: universal stress protein [Actinomycetota bacterium]
MKVLVATDDSDASRAAETLLGALARRDALDIGVLSVLALEPVTPLGYVPGNERLVWARDEVQQAASRCAERLGAMGFRTTTHDPVEGGAGPSIVRAVEAEGYGLTVMGAGRHTWLGGILLGSTSRYVVHTSPSAVLVVHEAPGEDRPVRVLLAADGSEAAAEASRTFRAVADPLRCAVTVVSVAEVPSVSTPVPSARAALGEAREAQLETARRVAAEAMEALVSDGFRAEGTTAVGSPAVVLLGGREPRTNDLVVVGSRGLGPLQRLRVGSVTDTVVRRSPAALVGPKPSDG